MTDEEKKLIQKWKAGQSNAAGRDFETLIEAACKIYWSKGDAFIEKTPEPFRVTKKLGDGMFMGRFGKAAQPDFQGTLKGGRSIVFEAKYTSHDRILRSVLTQDQMDRLEAHEKLGALSAVCFGIGNKHYFMPWSVWRDMKERYGRQYLTQEDISEYELEFNGAILFLNYRKRKG